MLANIIALVYQHDTSRLDHLAGKARFLRKHPAEATLIFANWSPGNSIEDSKAGLRSEFNSSLIADAGPHDHLFHACDAAWDSWRLLRVFDGPAFYLRAFEALRAGKGDRLREYPTEESTIGRIPVNSLRISILSGSSSTSLVNVTETPHYEFLEGNEDKYRKYLTSHLGYGIRSFHSVKRFRELSNETILNPLIVKKNGSLYTVLDGAHRAAILAHRGERQVNAVIQ